MSARPLALPKAHRMQLSATQIQFTSQVPKPRQTCGQAFGAVPNQSQNPNERCRLSAVWHAKELIPRCYFCEQFQELTSRWVGEANHDYLHDLRRGRPRAGEFTRLEEDHVRTMMNFVIGENRYADLAWRDNYRDA